MFSYVWPVDCEYETRIANASFSDGWERVNRRKCAYHHSIKYDYGENNALHRVIKYEKFYFVSYATPIVKIERASYFDTAEILRTNVYLNEEMYNISNTTIHQLSYFLRMLENRRGYDISYAQLKNSMKSVRMHFFYTDYIAERTKLHRMLDSEMRDIFTKECPPYAI